MSRHGQLSGHTLIELVLVLALVGACAVGGASGIVRAVRATEARSSAQAWQAAAAAAQSRALWSGRAARLTAEASGMSLSDPVTDVGPQLLHLGALATNPVANVDRWSTASGVAVTFAGGTAAPDSGGSVAFGGPDRAIRVVVRVESGLTARSAR